MSSKNHQSCAACKYQRRRCSSECPLAPYFPANQPKTFHNAHRLFGVCRITKRLGRMETRELRDEAMRSVIYEADMRERYPVHGCCGIIRHLHAQLVQAVEQLQNLQAQLAMISKEQYCHHDRIVDQNYSIHPEQFAVNLPSDVQVMGLPNLCMNDVANQYEGQYPNYNSVAIQSQSFPPPQGTEVGYDGIPFDTLADADDGQSYIESKEECESSCASSWENTTHSLEHASENDLKSAAACLRFYQY